MIVPTVVAAQAQEIVPILAATKNDQPREDAHVLPKTLAEAAMLAIMKLAAKAVVRELADVTQADGVKFGTRQQEI